MKPSTKEETIRVGIQPPGLMALARELGKARHPTRTYVVYFIAKCASQKIADAPPPLHLLGLQNALRLVNSAVSFPRPLTHSRDEAMHGIDRGSKGSLSKAY